LGLSRYFADFQLSQKWLEQKPDHFDWLNSLIVANDYDIFAAEIPYFFIGLSLDPIILIA